MCIIISKPSGVDLPSEEILNNCYASNKDGIGFTFNKTGEKPVIAKGYANVKKLIKMLDTYNVNKEHNLIIHFRFATHGHKSPENCHPYPLTTDYKQMGYLDFTCEVAIAHNGIFSGMPAHEKHSDTMKFIGGVLAQPEIIGHIESNAVRELIKGYCGYHSKLSFLRASGITNIGDFQEDKGIYYSNGQYKSWGTRYDYDDGKSWCYIHKVRDDCQWCLKHKASDLGEFNSKKNILVDSKGDLLLDLRKKCAWCQSKDNVRYDYNVQSELCDECTEIWDTAGSVIHKQERDY